LGGFERDPRIATLQKHIHIGLGTFTSLKEPPPLNNNNLVSNLYSADILLKPFARPGGKPLRYLRLASEL
jgi:hypothetical protein